MGRKAKRPQKKAAESTSYSFTEPVVRIIQDKAKKKPASSQKKPAGRSHNSGREAHLSIFYKKKDKGEDVDIFGARNLSAWRNFSGRAKSWKACKRFKITKDELEVLTNSNGHPVSFGWRFSATNVPVSFARCKGLHVNKPPKARRTKTLSSFEAFDKSDLDEEYTTPDWPRTRYLPQHLWYTRGEILAQNAIPTETVESQLEALLEGVTLTALQPAHDPGQEPQTDIVPKSFIVRELLYKDSFADVYLMRDTKNHSVKYIAHAFPSDGLVGNIRANMRRKMDRLKKSTDFHHEAAGFGRKILIMKATVQAQRAQEASRVKIFHQEFPALPGIDGNKPSQKTALKKRRSNAAVVARGLPVKKVVKPNNIAYAAWLERHGLCKPKREKGVNGSMAMAVQLPDMKLEDFLAGVRLKAGSYLRRVNPLAWLWSIGVHDM